MTSKFKIGSSTTRLWIRHTWRLRWALFLGILGIVVSIPTLSFNSILAFVLGASGILISTTTILVEVIKSKRLNERLIFTKTSIFSHKDLHVADWLKRNGYELKGHGDRASIESPMVNVALASGEDMSFSINSEEWQMPSTMSIEWKTYLLNRVRQERKIIFEAEKIRLSEEPVFESGKFNPVGVQLTSYLAGFWTNENASIDLLEAEEVRFRGHEMFMEGEEIVPLGSSRCSNGLGISTLLIGEGTELPLVQQSVRSAQAATLLAPSGSGSADFEDIRDGDTTLGQVICRAAEREMREELGLSQSVILQSQVIGFNRVVVRGGKPEFYCVSWLKSRGDRAKLTKIERLFTHHSKGVSIDWQSPTDQLSQKLRDASASNGPAYSPVLHWNIEMLANALITAPADAPFRAALL